MDLRIQQSSNLQQPNRSIEVSIKNMIKSTNKNQSAHVKVDSKGSSAYKNKLGKVISLTNVISANGIARLFSVYQLGVVDKFVQYQEF